MKKRDMLEPGWGPPSEGDRVRWTKGWGRNPGMTGTVTAVYATRDGRRMIDVRWDDQLQSIWYVWDTEWSYMEPVDDPEGARLARRRDLQSRRSALTKQVAALEKKIEEIDEELRTC